MSDSTYRQWIELLPGSSEPPMMTGYHVLAVSDTPQSWNFPLIYEYQDVVAAVAVINIDGQSTTLEPGPQQISGDGQNVVLIWEMSDGASIKFGSNPSNIPGIEDGYPNKDIQLSASEFDFQLSAAESSMNWSLDVNVEFQDGASAQQLSLTVDGSTVADLPVGPSHAQYQGWSIGLAIGGLSGGGVKIGYTLTSSLVEAPADVDASRLAVHDGSVATAG
jgi:hypothetical protein